MRAAPRVPRTRGFREMQRATNRLHRLAASRWLQGGDVRSQRVARGALSARRRCTQLRWPHPADQPSRNTRSCNDPRVTQEGELWKRTHAAGPCGGSGASASRDAQGANFALTVTSMGCPLRVSVMVSTADGPTTCAERIARWVRPVGVVTSRAASMESTPG